MHALRWRSTECLPTGTLGSTRRTDDEEVLTRYSVVYEQGDTSWGAYVRDLPGCMAAGKSRQEVEALIVQVIAAYLQDLRNSDSRYPSPAATPGWSRSDKLPQRPPEPGRLSSTWWYRGERGDQRSSKP